jgi:hypothetical protein
LALLRRLGAEASKSYFVLLAISMTGACLIYMHAYPHTNFPDRLVRTTVTICKRAT